jgi:hypothetical protein
MPERSLTPDEKVKVYTDEGGTEPIFCDAENLKIGDYIFPWDLLINLGGGIPYKIFSIQLRGTFIYFKIVPLGSSLLTFHYQSKIGNKERLCIID